MTKKEHIKYWLQISKHDLKTANVMFENKRYDWCLFLGHLILEKILKAFWVRDNKGDIPPKIHKLDKIASETKLQLNNKELDFLKELNEFNLETRYPDYKLKFYKICTKKYTENYFKKIKEFYKCLLKKIK